MSKFGGFLDNLINGALSPKGDMADYAHAARLYTDDNFRLAPKTKFLYHVAFNINEDVIKKVRPNFDKKHGLEINMLVKSADLPKYNITTETKNKVRTTTETVACIHHGYNKFWKSATTDTHTEVASRRAGRPLVGVEHRAVGELQEPPRVHVLLLIN